VIAVPLQPVPNQTTQIVLANQSCQISLSQTPFGLFMDLLVNDAPIVLGVICQNQNRIVRDLYFGFVGDFGFVDTQGLGADPDYTGLGSRFVLFYLSPAEAGDT
jgi:uncharacterized protein DUF6983